MIRLLKLEDYSTIFSLLSQLTSAPILDKIHYKKFLEELPKNHYIFVYELNKQLVGSITLIIESKLIHNGYSVGHIEDLVVDQFSRDKGIASQLIKYCIEEAKKYNTRTNKK